MNLFAYSRQRPTLFVDPDGRNFFNGIGASQAIGAFLGCLQLERDLSRMKRREGDFSYRWAHCYASCKIRENCAGSAPGVNDVLALVAGAGKEVVDVVHCAGGDYFQGGSGRSNHCESAFQLEDFQDNFRGVGPRLDPRSCRVTTCEDKCRSLEEQRTVRPGPFFDWGPQFPFSNGGG